MEGRDAPTIKKRQNVKGILKAFKLEWKCESFEFLHCFYLVSCKASSQLQKNVSENNCKETFSAAQTVLWKRKKRKKGQQPAAQPDLPAWHVIKNIDVLKCFFVYKKKASSLLARQLNWAFMFSLGGKCHRCSKILASIIKKKLNGGG